MPEAATAQVSRPIEDFEFSDQEGAYIALAKSRLDRPFEWQTFVIQRRWLYSFLCTVVLVVAVVWPWMYGMAQMSTGDPWPHVKYNQIALFGGAFIVLCFVAFSWLVYRQYDDSKWLARRGLVSEANLLSVLRNQTSMLVSYRFWDNKGTEQYRETIIAQDGPMPLSKLESGDVVPVLYDPTRPGRRNFLWAEIARYVRLRSPLTIK